MFNHRNVFDSIVTTRWRVLTNDRRIIVALRVCSCWSILLGKTLCCNHVQWELNSKNHLYPASTEAESYVFFLELNYWSFEIAVAPVQRGWSMLHIIVFEYSQKRTRCRMSPCSNRDCVPSAFLFIIYSIAVPRTSRSVIDARRLTDFESLSLCVFIEDRQIFSIQPEPKWESSISEISKEKEKR